MNIESIHEARCRIDGAIHQTPVVSSQLLNDWIGHDIFFKAECLQKVGAFKARGALNAIKTHVGNHGATAGRIISNSSGNHAQAVAWACRQQGVDSTIYMPKDTSSVKVQATRDYGAEVVLLCDRNEVDAAARDAAEEKGVFWVPPYNHDWVIAGQGTAIAEAFEQIEDANTIDGVFAPCGGGGLLSGTLIATRHLSPKCEVIGVEPATADDAFRSRNSGVIEVNARSPETLADGARTLSVGERTFPYIQQLDDLLLCSEQRIVYWTQWLSHLLKLRIEPTSAMVMDGVSQWLSQRVGPRAKKRRVLVILSGGNMDAKTTAKIWETDVLNQRPSLS